MPKQVTEAPEGTRGTRRKTSYRLSIRIYLPSGLRIGRGKIALLEAVNETGSISGAARLLNMSYKRAWDLLEELNSNFKERVIVTNVGGGHGGGAELSPSGRALIEHYRAFEEGAYAMGKAHLQMIARMEAEG
jgi:molybdate transport system regulatory protein